MTLYIGLVSGKGGVGKSLGYSEYVSLADGNIIEIGPFIDRLIDDQKDKVKYLMATKVDGSYELFEVLTPPDDLILDVVHFNYEGQSLISEKRKPVCLMRKPAPKTLLRINSPAGSIDVTEEHKFIVMRHGILKKVEAKAIQPKVDYLLLFNPKTYGGNTVDFSEKISELLGYLMGDGHIEKRKDHFIIHIFAGKDSSLLSEIKNAFESVFGSYTCLIDKRTGVCRVSFSKKEPIKNLFEQYKIKKVTAGKKFIPEKIFMSNNKCVSAFVRALFDCDAYVSKNRLEIEYVSKSKKLVFQVASLLRTRYGLCSQIKYTYKKASNSKMIKQMYWRLYISGENAIKYNKHIGFKESRKKKRLNWLVNHNELNTNIDVFPVGRLLKDVRIKNNLTATQLSSVLGCTKQLIYEYEQEQYALSKNMLIRFVVSFKKIGVPDDDLFFLRNLTCSGYSFRRVESVEETNYDKRHVYDFQVCDEGGHFVHASGIVVSNTTTAINLGSALNYFDRDVTVIDGNLSTPNIGIHLGVPILPINLHHVLQGKNKIKEAMYVHPAGTKIIPAGISLEDIRNTTPDTLPKVIRNLEGNSDIIIIDGAAGLGREALATINAADQLIIVTNPEMPAITDALKTIKLSEALGKKVMGVVLTRTKPNNMDVAVKNIETMLEKPILGIIPEDKSVREALVKKDAVVYTHPKSGAAIAYKKLAANLIGQDYTEVADQNDGFLRKIMRRIGLA